MSGMINWLGRITKVVTGSDGLEEKLSYDESKELASNADPKVRAQLAARVDVRPEILYYLAEDENPIVRQKIAQNFATPIQADRILAKDQDDEVRIKLAGKIAKAVPNLPENKQNKLRDMAFDVLKVLVEDELPRVREILAEELKHANNVPKDVITKLANDKLFSVAGPILEFSPLLNDDDLLQIINTTELSEALSAVARRQKVSGTVADAIVGAKDHQAIAHLLKNPTAQIREETLDKIVATASKAEVLHEPLVRREKLSPALSKKIAGFVSSSMLMIMAERNDLDPEVAALLTRKISKRIEDGKGNALPPAGPGVSLPASNQPGPASAAVQAGPASGGAEEVIGSFKETLAKGEINEDLLIRAIEQGNRGFVTEALAHLGKMSTGRVDRILKSRNGRAVTALSWQCGIAMRTAMQIQSKIAAVPPNQVVNARNGFDYPLSKDEMELLLDLFVETKASA